MLESLHAASEQLRRQRHVLVGVQPTTVAGSTAAMPAAADDDESEFSRMQHRA